MPRIRNYIFVPFNEKEEAKKLGALWDNKNKKFYIPTYLEKIHFLNGSHLHKNIKLLMKMRQ